MQNSKLWWAMLITALSGCGSGAVVPLQSIERSEHELASAGVTASDYAAELDLLAIGYKDGTFELRSPAPDHVLSRGKHPSAIVNVALSPDGARLATIDASGTLVVSDVQTGELHEIDADAPLEATTPGLLIGLAWDPAGRQLAIAAGLSLRLIDVESAAARVVTLKEQVGALCFTHDGKRLVAAGKRLHVFHTDTLVPERELELPHHPDNGRSFDVTDVRFSPDDSRLAVLLLGGLALVDVASGRAELGVLPELDPVGIRFAPDGRVAVFGRHAVYVGDAKPERMASSVQPVKGNVADVEFRKDGSLLVLGAVEDTEQALLQWHL